MSIQKTIDRLPSMKFNEVRQLWENCVSVSKDSARYPDARKVIQAIYGEWEKRGKLPPKENEYFDWPSTDVRGGNGKIDTTDWETEGVLATMGYRVGQTNGLAQNIRQKLLTEIFQGVLPPVFSDYYMSQWGRPNSSARLQKMAETIAALTRNAKRKDSLMGTAIHHWEKDLEFLYYEYYVEKFHFGWPSASTA